MEIVFVRHAQKSKDGLDPGLTTMGVKQAKYLARQLEKEKFSKIYSSDMKRAIQTFSIIGKSLNLNLEIETSLSEFELSVLEDDERNWDNKLKEKYNKLKEFLDKLTKDANSDKKILIVAHGNTNRVILQILLELDLKNLVRFGQAETAINRVDWLDEFVNWRFKGWNDVNHLPKKLIVKEIY